MKLVVYKSCICDKCQEQTGLENPYGSVRRFEGEIHPATSMSRMDDDSSSAKESPRLLTVRI